MAPNTPDEFAWAHDPSLTEEERWHAMKLWKAKKRVEFTQSARAREEYAAWLARETPSQVEVKLKQRQKQKVFRIS